jgi:gliding motility-associated-like protein
VHVGASAQCAVLRTFTLEPPTQVEAQFSASPWIATIESPVIEFTNESTGWDSLYWQVIGVDEMHSGDSIWTATFPKDIATYAISLTAMDTAGCASVYTASIIIKDTFKVFVPNSFSPNDDGLNDFFAPVFSYPPLSYSMTIVDRWGQPVFVSDDYSKVWMGNAIDGTHYVSDGVYEWMMSVRGAEIDTQVYKGTVTIIR